MTIGALQEILQLEHLIESCRHMQEELRTALDLMEQGGSMRSILAREGAEGVIPQLTEAIEQTNAARRVGRGNMIRLALSEGMSARELGQRLGISRQLVARYRDEV